MRRTASPTSPTRKTTTSMRHKARQRTMPYVHDTLYAHVAVSRAGGDALSQLIRASEKK